jgi:RNA polymerase sigma-70 factor (ECF subfamily)
MAPGRFITTRWTLIGEVGLDDDRGQAALAELCQAYWRPVYSFIRRQGHPAEAAADLTQEVFAHLLEHRGFQRADPGRGRFRSYLLTAVRHFLINWHLREASQRRGRNLPHQSIDIADAEERFVLEAPAFQSSPEAAFERQWALTTIERAMTNLASEYGARGQGVVFDELRTHLLSDSLGVSVVSDHRVEPPAATSAMSNEARRAALSRLRRRFGEALRAEIAGTVADSTEVDDEVRQLLRALSA